MECDGHAVLLIGGESIEVDGNVAKSSDAGRFCDMGFLGSLNLSGQQ